MDPAPVLTQTESTPEPICVRPQRLSDRPIGFAYVVSQVVSSLPLMIADAAAIGLTLLVASLVGLPVTLTAGLCIAAALLAVYMFAGHYPGIGIHPATELKRCTLATLCAMLPIASVLATTGLTPTLLLGGVVAPVALIAVPSLRAVARHAGSRFDAWTQPVIIFGSGKQATDIYTKLKENRRFGLRPVGFVDVLEAQWMDTEMDPNWFLGEPEQAARIAASEGVYWAVVSSSVDEGLENHRTLEQFAGAFPHRLYAPGVEHPKFLDTDRIRTFGNTSMLYRRDLLALPAPRMVKRTLDLVIASIVAALVLPLMLVIAIWIKLSSRGPTFYAPERIGRNGKMFRTLKFRTMRADAAQILERCLAENPELEAEWREKHKLTNDPRVTPLGSLLRKSSLDELPQVINVLKGEMSLVGPRPIVTDEIERYDEVYDSYCRVLPGVTGLWQVSGRNRTTYPERVAFDEFYVQNWSPWLDLYILARTGKVVLTQDGAY